MLLLLDATTKSIEAVSDTGTADVVFVTAYADSSASTFTEGSGDGTVGTVDVTVVNAPGTSTRRVIKSINFYNTSAGARTVTLKYNNNGTKRTVAVFTLTAGENWSTDDLAGGGGGISSLTVGTTPVTGTNNNILYVNGSVLGELATTGTGSVVRASSPTLTTPDLGTPSAVILTNATQLPLSTGVTGTLPVPNGGTGSASLAANNVLLGNGTDPVQAVAPGPDGNVLTSNGTTWISEPSTGGRETLTATRNYFVAPATGTLPATYLGFSGWINGSDSNDGLSQTTPFASIQKAINTINGLDCGIYTVNLYICKGTYNEALSIISPNLTYVVNIIGDDAEGTGSLICHGVGILPGNGPFSGRIPTIARQATTTQLLVTWSGAVSKTFQECGWGAGDTVFAIYPIAQTTTSTGSTAKQIVVNSTAGLNVYDNILLAGFGYAGKAATARILAISGSTLTLADPLTSAPASGVTVYKIRYDPYTLSAVSGNLLTATTPWPATTLAGTILGWSILRVPNCVIDSPAGQTAVYMLNSRSYTLRGLRMKATNIPQPIISINGSSAVRMAYNTLEHFTLTTNPFALFWADGNCTITDLLGNVAGQMTIMGNAQYSGWMSLSSGAQHTGFSSIGSQYGFAVAGNSVSRGNSQVSIFQTRPFYSLEGSFMDSLTSVSSCVQAQTTKNGSLNTVTYL